MIKNYKTTLVSAQGETNEAVTNLENPTTPENPDNPGGDESSNTVEVIKDSVVHNFTNSGLTSKYFTIEGKLSSSKGSVVYNGETLTQCLKIETSKKIDFENENNMNFY